MVGMIKINISTQASQSKRKLSAINILQEGFGEAIGAAVL